MGADLVDAGVGLGLLLGGGVQTPQRGEATLPLAGGARRGLSPPPHATLTTGRHLGRQWGNGSVNPGKTLFTRHWEKLHYCAAQEKRQKGGNLFGIAIKKRG